MKTDKINQIDVELATVIVLLDGIAVAGRSNRMQMLEAERRLSRAREMIEEMTGHDERKNGNGENV